MPPVDPSVIAALEAGVEAAPHNRALRRHLASLLVESSRYPEALQHCASVLALEPDDVETLRIACAAALATGDEALASRYSRLITALGGESSPEVPEIAEAPERVPLRVIQGGADDSMVQVESSGITLKDVAGMEEVKRRIDLAFLAPMRSPDLRRMYGKQLRGGLLLYGPPGCGKTFIARAVAGELGARFISIGISDVLDMWLGSSERNLHEVFDTARENAPCVLFFDEMDALGRKRSLMRESSGRNIVNQLLAELDSVDSVNEGLFVLAATNHPWDVDTALRRPGRFDRTLLVLPPDEPARAAILKGAMRDRPVESMDVELLAQKTEGYSGADLVHLCETATELALDDSLQSGSVRPIRHSDFMTALREVKPTTRAWFATARNYAEFANEGGMFDDLVAYLRKHKIR